MFFVQGLPALSQYFINEISTNGTDGVFCICHPQKLTIQGCTKGEKTWLVYKLRLAGHFFVKYVKIQTIT
ncbi:MAG: hypothetical protein Q3990_06500, partial [Desulfovibrionaceae bacterium]|nr:hypothetical protein [Desulfovibrionaceae bacterium]